MDSPGTEEADGVWRTFSALARLDQPEPAPAYVKPGTILFTCRPDRLEDRNVESQGCLKKGLQATSARQQPSPSDARERTPLRRESRRSAGDQESQLPTAGIGSRSVTTSS